MTHTPDQHSGNRRMKLVCVPPSAFTLGAVSFDVYVQLNKRFVLFCRKGYAIVERHLEILQSPDLQFFVQLEDWDRFADYARDTLEQVVEDTRVPFIDRSRLLSHYARRRIHEILESPGGSEVPQTARQIAGLYGRLAGTSPEAVITLFAMSSIDEYNVSHAINTCLLNILIGGFLFEEDPGKLTELGTAGLLHDIGKMSIDHTIISRPGGLSPREFEMVKKHTIEGERILSKHKLDTVHIQTARSHHERIDGSGYPDGLSGYDIPRFARITAVSDVYDALTSKRAYKDEILPVEALSIMLAEEDKFDAAVLNSLLRITLRRDELVDGIRRMVRQNVHEVMEADVKQPQP